VGTSLEHALSLSPSKKDPGHPPHPRGGCWQGRQYRCSAHHRWLIWRGSWGSSQLGHPVTSFLPTTRADCSRLLLPIPNPPHPRCSYTEWSSLPTVQHGRQRPGGVLMPPAKHAKAQTPLHSRSHSSNRESLCKPHPGPPRGPLAVQRRASPVCTL
jgi:hypothetical protein